MLSENATGEERGWGADGTGPEARDRTGVTVPFERGVGAADCGGWPLGNGWSAGGCIAC